MNRLAELQEKRGRLMTQAREALNEITANTDESRAKELDERHDKIMAEFDALEKNIERERKLADLEKREEESRAARRPPMDDKTTKDDDKPTDEYREVFAKLLSGVSPGELSAEERQILRRGSVPFGKDGEAEKRVQSTSNSAGGYTVPTTLANFIVKSMAMWGPMYDEAICTVLNTSSGEQINIPTINDTSDQTAKTAEGTALTDDGGVDVTVVQKVLNAYTYDTEFIRWSIELSQDSAFNWEELLANLLGERLGRRANTELTVGDGTGDPNGIVTASTLGATAAVATALTADELMDVQHSVDPAYRVSPKARWMFNDSTLKAVRKLKDGNGNYLFQLGNIGQGIPSTLLDKPYSINQAMANIGSGNKPVIFGDFSRYFVRRVGGPIIGVLRERFWPSLGIAGLIRIDGELGDTAAVKHLVMP